MRALTALVLAAFLGAAQQPPRDVSPRPTVGTASISGRVIVLDSNPRKPVRRARVTLRGDPLAEPEFTDTDTEGRYRFDGLPAGMYRMTLEKPGYVTVGPGATQPASQAPSVELVAGQSATINFEMPPGAALEGRSLSDDGDPLQNVVVTALRQRYRAAGVRPAPAGQAATDDTGRFRIHSLPPGEYYLHAAPDPLRSRVSIVGSRGYAGTYYPGTSRVHEARSLRPATGQDLRGLDFALSFLAVANVSIQVVDSAGAPPRTTSARLQPVSGALLNHPGLVGSPAKGRVNYMNVAPGDYWLTVSAIPATGGDPEFAASRLTVEGKPIDNLPVKTEPGARIEGRVEISGGGLAPALGAFRFIAHEVEFEVPNPGGAAAPVTIARDLTFNVPSLFGPRLLRLEGLPSGWALEAVWLDDREISDLPIDFRASGAPAAVRMVITKQTATVSGTVVDQRTRTAGAARIVLFPEDEARWTWEARHVRSVVSAADGRFSIEGLLPATYLAVAVPHLEDRAWNDRDVLRRLRPHATRITVAAREKASLALTVRELP